MSLRFSSVSSFWLLLSGLWSLISGLWHLVSARVPPPQHNFQDAVNVAIRTLRGQSPEQLAWLGARLEGERWVLDVLGDRLSVDLRDGSVRTTSGSEAGRFWRILTLHYLCVAGQPVILPPAVGFADLAGGRAYAPVYRARVIGRLCRTAGVDRRTLQESAEALGGIPVDVGDLGFDFQVFPQVRVQLAWYEGDDELTPSAALLLPPNVESFFPVEDVVVLSECLVARLGGKPF